MEDILERLDRVGGGRVAFAMELLHMMVLAKSVSMFAELSSAARSPLNSYLSLKSLGLNSFRFGWESRSSTIFCFELV